MAVREKYVKLKYSMMRLGRHHKHGTIIKLPIDEAKAHLASGNAEELTPEELAVAEAGDYAREEARRAASKGK